MQEAIPVDKEKRKKRSKSQLEACGTVAAERNRKSKTAFGCKKEAFNEAVVTPVVSFASLIGQS